MCVAVYQSSAGLQAAIARALNVKQPPEAATTAGPLLRAAVLNLTRPLFVAPVITMAHVSEFRWDLFARPACHKRMAWRSTHNRGAVARHVHPETHTHTHTNSGF